MLASAGVKSCYNLGAMTVPIAQSPAPAKGEMLLRHAALAELLQRGEDSAQPGAVELADRLLSQLPPELAASVIPGVSPGQGVALIWSRWPRTFHYEIEVGYSDAYTLDDGVLTNLEAELSPADIIRLACWAQGQ